MITIESGAPAEYWPLISSMAVQNSVEALDNPLIAIDVDLYQRAWEIGSLIALFAFYGSVPIGYAVTWISGDPHSMNEKKALSDAIFVDEHYRNTGAGLMLMRMTEAIAKDMGACSMSWGAKEGSRLEALLERLNYKRVALYTKVI